MRALLRIHHLTSFLLVALAFSSSACRGNGDDDDALISRIDARPLSLAGGVEPLQNDERLTRLFMPGPSGPKDVSPREAFSGTTNRQGRLDVPITLEADHCVTAVASGGTTPFRLRLTRKSGAVDDVRSVVMGSDDAGTGAENDGTRSANPASPAPMYAAVLSSICADTAGTYRIEISSRAAQAMTVVWQDEGKNTPLTHLQSVVQDALPGFRRAGPPQRHTLVAAQRAQFPLFVSAGRCIGVAAQGEGDVVDLDARFLSLTGEELALDVSTDTSAVVGPYCPYEDEVIRVEFRMYDGQGSFQWQVWDEDETRGRALENARRASPDGRLPPRD